MGFQLVIAEGKEAGREFVFDQKAILIGRVDECDVVLFESGVSRKHASITAVDDQWIIEDQGSSNGTFVNGEKITRQPLKDGDAIAMGPVVFTFSRVADTSEATVPPPAEEGGAHTRIVNMSELKRSRNKGVVGLNKSASRQEVAEFKQRSTAMVPALKLPADALDTVPPKSARGPRPSLPEAGGLKPRPSRPQELSGVRVGGAATEEQRAGLSAADKARIRRESGGGAVAKARIWWTEQPPKRQRVLMGVAGAVALLLVGGVVAAAWPKEKVKRPPEPTTLGPEPVEFSFGHGAGVTFDRPDQKAFEFDVKTPVQAMAIVHLQAADLSLNEVAVSVNGQDLGFVAADTLNANERTLEILVPAQLVKRDQPNTILFDNTLNPPGTEAWRIWNLWVEVAVLPEKDAPGLIADAQVKYQRAALKWEQRDIGAGNRWDAYRGFREAWLTLESLPRDQRPATYDLARQRMHEVTVDLDAMCNKLLLDARRAYAVKQWKETRYALDHVKEFFPSRAHPCQYRAALAEEEMTDVE